MALRRVTINGEEVLRKVASKVENIDKDLLKLIEDMKDTMYHCDGVGIAAPQVGVSKRLIVIDIGEGPIVCINPEIIEMSGEEIDIEGCLSVPEVEGEVKRPKNVKVRFINEKGQLCNMKASGLLARAFCHEIDHLEGILFIDKVEKKEK